MLASSGACVTRADAGTQFSVLSYSCLDTFQVSDGAHLASRSESCPTFVEDAHYTATTQPQDGTVLAARSSSATAPTGLSNIGNTCFMNAIVQCCKQMFSRVPSDMLPQSDGCPLAPAFRQQSPTQADITKWPCWRFLPPGPQRDACQILEMCFDTKHPMHGSCESGDCFAALFQKLASFEITRELLCDGCSYANQDCQTQCFFRAEPRGNAEVSINTSLAVSHIDGFTCEACGSKQGKQQNSVSEVPQFFVVHFNKYADSLGPATHANVSVCGNVLQRVAAVQHIGHTPESGHYTSTVVSRDGVAYRCNDEAITSEPHLCEGPWQNCYLVFLQRDGSSDSHSAAASLEAAPAGRKTSEECCNDLHFAATDGDALSDGVDCANDAGDEARSEEDYCDDEDKDNQGGQDTENAENACGDSHPAETGPTMQATDCRVTSTRHDDWLHRGFPFFF